MKRIFNFDSKIFETRVDFDIGLNGYSSRFWIQFKFPISDLILNIVGSSCILAEKRFISEIFCLDQFFSHVIFWLIPFSSDPISNYVRFYPWQRKRQKICYSNRLSKENPSSRGSKDVRIGPMLRFITF